MMAAVRSSNEHGHYGSTIEPDQMNLGVPSPYNDQIHGVLDQQMASPCCKRNCALDCENVISNLIIRPICVRVLELGFQQLGRMNVVTR